MPPSSKMIFFGYVPRLTDFAAPYRRSSLLNLPISWALEPYSSDLVLANGSGKIKVPGQRYWPDVGLAVWNPLQVADCFSPRSQTSVELCFMLCFDASQAMRLRDVDDLLWPTAAVRKRSRPSLTVITAAAPRCRFSGGGRSGSGTIGI